MHHLTKVKAIHKLNEEELRRRIPMAASWHMKESAYIYVGGFPYEITEGDLAIVFSQYGEIVDWRMIRDKETGKSKGFGFICYEDQRSTILAVDNLNGADICGRVIRVDHVEQFKIPREYFEGDELNENGELKVYKPTGPDGRGWGEDRLLTPQDVEHFRKMREAEAERDLRQTRLAEGSKLILDADEKWEKEFEKMLAQEKASEEMEKDGQFLKKKKKKEKKEKKKKKKKKKEEKKKEKRERELRKIYSSYGIYDVKEPGQNLSYIKERRPKNQNQDEEI